MTEDLEKWLQRQGDEYAEDWAADNQPVEHGGPGSSGGEYRNRYHEAAAEFKAAREENEELRKDLSLVRQNYDEAGDGGMYWLKRAEQAEAENRRLREALQEGAKQLGSVPKPNGENIAAGWIDQADNAITNVGFMLEKATEKPDDE